MNTIPRKSVAFGLIIAVIVAVISWVWTSRGSNYHGYDGLIVGVFTFVGLIIGTALTSLILVIFSRHVKHKSRIVAGIIIAAGAIMLMLQIMGFLW